MSKNPFDVEIYEDIFDEIISSPINYSELKKMIEIILKTN